MITSLTRRADFIGSGILGPFSFSFRIFDPADLQVTHESAIGDVTTLTYVSDFTLEGIRIGNDEFGGGGFLTLLTPLATGERLTILRSPEQTQPRSFTNAGPYFPKNHEEALDRLTMLVQAQQDEIDRSIKQSVLDGTGTDLVLPPAEALKLIGWDAGGTQLANYDNDFKEAAVETFTNGIGFTSGVTTVLSLLVAPGTEANAIVFFDGVEQDHSKWSLGGTDITFNVAIVATKVEVCYRRTIDVSAMVGANQKDATQFGAIGNGIADDTVAMQNLWNWSAATGGWAIIRGPKTYMVSNLIIRDGMKVFIDNNAVVKHKSGAVTDMVTLPPGVVQRVLICGKGQWRGNGNAGKHGFYLRAQPILEDGVIQGGIWWSKFDHLDVKDFLGEQIWLHGAGDFTGPNQFLIFENCQVESAALNKRALRLTGQVGQVEFVGGQFDGAGRSLGTENVLIQRSVNYITLVQDTDLAPYLINFRGTTFQSSQRAATVERAQSITFDACYFEACPEGVMGDVSVINCRVINSQFNNMGHRDNGDGSGWIVKCNNGSMLVENNTFGASSPAVAPDTHYINLVAPPDAGLTIQGRHIDSTGIRTSGIAVQMGAATASLQIGGFKQVAFQTSSTAITGIQHLHHPGTIIHILASNGPLFFNTDVPAVPAGVTPITLSPFGEPVVLIQDACATFILEELGGVYSWRLLSMAMPTGQVHLKPIFVNVSGNVTGRGGSELIDTSGGNIVRTLPTVSPAVPPGFRMTFKKISGDTNTVTIVGAEQGSNYVLNSGNHFCEVEFNGTNWMVTSAGATGGTAQANLPTTAAINVTPWGFASQAQADNLTVAINRCLDALRRINLIT